MSRFVFKSLFSLLILFATPLLWASDEASEWLQRMTTAMHQLNYDGVFIYSHDGNIQTMRIIHGVGENGERERLVSLNGPSREVIRDQEKVTCYLSDDRSVLEQRVNPGRAFPIKLPERLEQINGHYRMAVTGEDRVAGLPTKKITITPRDNYRYGHNIWLARDNGLLLRAEMVDEAGKEIEQLIFTQIAFYDSLPEQLLIPQIEGEGMVWHRQDRDSEETVDKFNWTITELPPGFTLKTSRRHQMSARTSEVEHQVYSDGLSSISIFVEPSMEGDSGFMGQSRKGAVSAYAHVANDRRITVVGEVPPATVELVANSVSYPGKERD